MTPGQRLQAARKLSGLSQAALADKIGVRPYQIYRYEAGVHEIPNARAAQIAEVLGISVSDIIGDAPSEFDKLSGLELEIVGLIRNQQYGKAINVLSKLIIDREASE